MFFRNALIKLKIDDPTDAISIHAFGGLFGLIVSPFLSKNGIILRGSTETLHYFAWNLLGSLILSVRSFGLCFIILGPFALCNKLGSDSNFHDDFKMRETEINPGIIKILYMNKDSGSILNSRGVSTFSPHLGTIGGKIT